MPEEVIIATIRANQKCFCLRDSSGKLAPIFIITSNQSPSDGGATIIAGNERVIRARLSRRQVLLRDRPELPLEQACPSSRKVVFHAKLGTQFQRVERLVKLAARSRRRSAPMSRLAKRAAMLAKADLTTGMVGEFPELQGMMGRYYALAQGEQAASPTPSPITTSRSAPPTSCPPSRSSIAVALADKLDTLTGFWAIDEKPTGSRDPFALRRAALGVIRIVTENELRLSLIKQLSNSAGASPRGRQDQGGGRTGTHYAQPSFRLDSIHSPSDSKSNCASRAPATISSTR